MTAGAARKRNATAERHSAAANGTLVVPPSEYAIVEAPEWDSGLEKRTSDYGKTMARRLFHWGPIIAIAITLVIGITASYLHVQWWPLTSVVSVLHFLVFLSFNYLVLVNLCQSAYIGPGYLPRHWTPPRQEDASRLQYCFVCDGYKAPRSHHCSSCGRCVLKMDHHCPWINNCVGHRNHGLFVRFLAAAVVGCLHGSIIIFRSLYHAFYRVWYVYHGWDNEPHVVLTLPVFICAVFAFGLALGVVVAVGFLLFIQLRGISRNRSGVEDYIMDKSTSYERDVPFVYPYNLGWRRNFADVLLTWSGIPRGNGIWWPLRYPATQFSFSEEQLAQKKIKRENARVVRITRESRGGCCSSIWIAPHIWACQPWNDEPRPAVKVGEYWMITRANKYWLYGRRTHMGDEEGGDGDLLEPGHLPPRGWFPKICVQRS